ncbi:MAG: ornithine carbamoyltransferase [Proteobacteria bacterium]|nr:ornithine carbamoyltransferase [Pseudomonadota bacterium]
MPEKKTTPKHFLDLSEVHPEDLRNVLEEAKRIKKDFKAGKAPKLLENKHLALIFEKPSTRTRISFEVGMNQLGGSTIYMDSGTSQMGRGETVADTARVLSRYVDAIMLRCYQHEMLKEMARHATVPLINGLTDYSHPCQVMADIMTFEEHRGSIRGKTVAWIGDCNNMANSWIQAAQSFDFKLRIACPKELVAAPANLPSNISIIESSEEAVSAADLVCTDTWVSMGDNDADYKRELLASYQVNDALMSHAKPDALFMHCLPAHRGEEVTDSVIDGKHSVVWDEAENRLHIQKAIILWCLDKLD